MTREYDRYFIRKTLEALLPGVHIEEEYCSQDAVRERYVREPYDGKTGIYNEKDQVRIWFDVDDGKSVVLSVGRDEIPISSREKDLLKYLPDALQHMLPEAENLEWLQIQRISARMALGSTIVSKFLHRKDYKGFWGPAYLLMILQGVLARDYEGNRATSGFVVIPKMHELEAPKLYQHYDIHLFEEPTQIDEDFFDDPVSYRYIDGRNAFYLIDRQSFVRGILRVREPLKWSLGNRVYGQHLSPLLNHLHGKTWAAIIGNSRDIQIMTRGGPEIRWSQNQWQFIHLENIHRYIVQHTENDEVALYLWKIAFMLSVMRIGALILIPNGTRKPEYASQIDFSALQDKIFLTMKGIHIKSFVDGVGMFGVFGSDGLVVVDKGGIIEEAGRIVATEKKDQAVAGGGRTQAASTCSKYGLVIKVSEDGPISIVHNERIILKTIG